MLIESSECLVYNRDKFETKCKAIIDQIKDRFIELAPVNIDDEFSNYADQIHEKQVKFKSEFNSKLQAKDDVFNLHNFTVSTDLASTTVEVDDEAQKEKAAALTEMDGQLGELLEDISKLLVEEQNKLTVDDSESVVKEI